MQSRTHQSECLSDDIVEHRSIAGCAKQIFLMIPSKRDVIARAGDMQTRASRHPFLLIRQGRISLDPGRDPDHIDKRCV